MALWLRRRLASDDGISLVEMMVAIFIVGLALTALANTTITSFLSIRANESRTRATALANEVLENMQAVKWSDLGFFCDDLGLAAACTATAAPTVTIGDSRAAAAPTRAPLPSEAVVRDGITYDVARSITWFDDPATSEPQDYKELRVDVTWSDGSRSRDLAVETLRAPNADEKVASSFVLSVVDARPSVVYTQANGEVLNPPPVTTLYPSGSYPVTPVALTAQTSAAADNVRVLYQRADGTTATQMLAGDSTRRLWNGSTLADPFPNGDVVFEFRAARTLPSPGVTVTKNKLVRFLRPLEITGFVLSPPGMCVDVDESPVFDAIVVDLTIQGSLEEDVVTVGWGGNSGEATFVSSDTSGASFRFTIPAGSYSGTTAIDASVLRLTDNQTTTRSETFTVQHAQEGEVCTTAS